jgi:UDP-N-acetylmuramoyl-L-alanyl-D-glutamate--2,6-diaminopimelate ligase
MKPRIARRSARMLLTDMLARAGLPQQGIAQAGTTHANLPNLAITGLTADSRQVGPGYLFAALPGARADGRRFIADAVAQGAAAVLAPQGTEWPPGVPPRPLILHAEPRRALALLAAAHAGKQPDNIVAVTGTNGKTSTVDFLRQLFTLAGLPAASLGTLGLIAPGHAGGGGLTTPDPVALTETLAQLAREGVRHAALEASSHGLDQYRLDGVRLTAAGFSNLTRDHLDYHGGMQAYRAAKLRLFADLLPAGAPAVVNADMDGETLAALGDIASRRKLDFRSVGQQGTAVRLLATAMLPHGQVIDIDTNGARRQVELRLPGRFQADNVLLAASLADAIGLRHVWDLAPRLHGVRGRMELAVTLDNGAAAYVDYAHTPDALERLLLALRPHTAGRLICVFGAGGDRDAGKRPLMGAAVARLADIPIITDDNPRTEDPALIRAAISVACPGALDIGDRAAAIAAGLNALRAGDVLVVAGKGHEQGQTIGTTILPFDDASTIRALAGAA